MTAQQTVGYVITNDSMVVTIDGVPYSINATHPAYKQVQQAVLTGADGAKIRALLDVKTAAEEYMSEQVWMDENWHGRRLVLAGDGGTYDGHPVDSVLVDRIISMMRQQLPAQSLINFMRRLVTNPSRKAVQMLYKWLSTHEFTLTPSGMIVAYKRVRDDFMSFHDGKTPHHVGTMVEMVRWAVEDDPDAHCAAGLHFCAPEYLKQYYSGRGRILVVLIDPKDVVSIPSDATFTKARCCRYYVQCEITDPDAIDKLENGKPSLRMIEDIPTSKPVKVVPSDVTALGYEAGYRAGRSHGRSAMASINNLMTRWFNTCNAISNSQRNEAESAFKLGFCDGVGHKAKRYGGRRY